MPALIMALVVLRRSDDAAGTSDSVLVLVLVVLVLVALELVQVV
jgi:hypothetical protein